MLLKYFYEKFSIKFFFIFLILGSIFAAADILMRIYTLPSLAFIPNIFIFVIPVASIFAIPLAIGITIQNIYAELVRQGSIHLLFFLKKSNRAFYHSTILFMIPVTILYSSLLFYLAPKSYLYAKKSIVEFATNHIGKLDVEKFHFPSSNFMIFFKDKKQIQNTTYFFDLILSLKKDQNAYFISAKEGVLDNLDLKLIHGNILIQEKKANILSTFDETAFDLETVFLSDKKNKFSSLIYNSPKFFTISQLLNSWNSPEHYLEFNARIAKIIWLLFFPFISLVGLFIFQGSNNFNFFKTACWSSILLIISYLIISIGQSFSNNVNLGLLIIYGLGFFIIGSILIIGRRYF